MIFKLNSKKLIMLLVFCSILNLKVYATETNVAADKNFDLILDNSHLNGFVKIIKTSDDGLITISNETVNDGSIGGIVKKYTVDGTLQWMTEINGSLTETLTHITELSNGGYLISGYSDSKDGDMVSGTQGTGVDGLIVRLTSSGEKNLIKLYGGTDNKEDRIGYVIEDNTGSYVFGMFSNSAPHVPSYSIVGTFLYKTDINGVILKTIRNTYQKAADASRNVVKIIQLKNGMYFYASTNVITAGINDGKANYYFANSNFERIYTGSFKNEDYYRTGIEHTADPTVPTILSFAGVPRTNSTDSSFKINPETQSNKETEYAVNFPSSTYFNDIIVNPNGGYIAVGSTSSSKILTPNKEDGLIFYFAEDLTIAKIIQMNASGNESFNSVSLIGDDLIISGTASESISIGTNSISGDFIIKYNESGYEKSLAPTINQIADGKIEIIDNNIEESKNIIEYNINGSGWIAYSRPFIPQFNPSGVFSLKVRATTLNGIISEEIVLSENDIVVEKSVSEELNAVFNQVNTLKITLSNNIVKFNEVNGFIDVESTSPIAITLSSSLPYSLEIKALGDFIGEDIANVLPSENLQVKIDSMEYLDLKNDYVSLLSNQETVTDKIFNLSFKLKAKTGIKKDIYRINTELILYQN